MSGVKMVLNRDHVMTTDSGIAVGFKKGVPVTVPQRYISKATNLGAEVADVDKEAVNKVLAEDAAAAKEKLALRDRLIPILKDMVDRNESGDFTSGGKPNRGRVMKRLGEEIDQKTLDEVFAEVRLELEKG